ncbi:MAG: nucleotidyltransferase [Sphingobacteriaceae bacterium]|nr:nucleotidyltransferase [Sphingobacteriaceae bacterium]MBK7818066.1 nucleotidyltransferase [Sphingobacteriaceae bacterium]
MGNILNEDFQEFILALNTAKVEYVLVGGYSVIYYGYPRTTGDLDVFVEVSLENYQKLTKAFSLFRMPTFDMTETNFLNNSEIDVFSFGRSPVSIEILKEISGLTFAEVNKNAIAVEFEGIKTKMIHLSDLIKNKKASGRPKDINDLENLDKKS